MLPRLPDAWAIAAALGVLSGIATHVATASGAPELMMLAPLPILAAGLALGPAAALMAIASGGALAGLLIEPAAILAYLAVVALPAWLLVQAMVGPVRAAGGWTWPPPGRPLLWLTGYGVLLVLLFAVELGGSAGMSDLTGHMVAQAGALIGQPLPPDAAALVGALARLLPALVVVVWLLALWVGAAAVQGLLARSGLALRAMPPFSAIALPRVVGLGTLAAAVLALAGGGEVRLAAVEMLPVLGLAHLLVGLAVLHGRAGQLARRRLALAGLYGVLAVGGILAMLPVAAIGLIDQWVPLRGKGRGDGRWWT